MLHNQVVKMQSPEVTALVNSIDSINARAKDIRKSLEDFLFKLDKEQATISWPSVLDNFALLSGQISNLVNAIKSEKTPPLRNFLVVPQRLSPDPDQYLLWTTEGRVSIMSHAQMPDYLRTKPDPEVEQIEKYFLNEVSAHGDHSATSSQVISYNRQCNKVLEKLKSRQFQRDVTSHSSSSTPLNTKQQTQELFATFYYGRGIKSLPAAPSVINVPM